MFVLTIDHHRSCTRPPESPLPARFRGGPHPCSERDGPLPDAACSPSPILGLGADRKGVRHDYGPLSDALNARLSHPAPACGRGAGGEGQTTHPNASNTEFDRMFYPSRTLLVQERTEKLFAMTIDRHQMPHTFAGVTPLPQPPLAGDQGGRERGRG
jgi:hypothetical protein